MPLGLVSVVLLENVKVPAQPFVMSMPASPPVRVVVPVKLYVPSALLNWRPVPFEADRVPVWKVMLLALWFVKLTIAALLACVMFPLYATMAVAPVPPPFMLKATPLGLVMAAAEPKKNVPADPFRMSTAASPPCSVVVPLKL